MKISEDAKNFRYINEIKVRIQETDRQITEIELDSRRRTKILRERIFSLDKKAQEFYKEHGDKYNS